jgi:hypothetical protein
LPWLLAGQVVTNFEWTPCLCVLILFARVWRKRRAA